MPSATKTDGAMLRATPQPRVPATSQPRAEVLDHRYGSGNVATGSATKTKGEARRAQVKSTPPPTVGT